MNPDNEKVMYSTSEAIQSLMEKVLLDINRAGIMVYCKKQIPYGTQLLLEGQGENGLINIFYSEKKGFSFVDCSKNRVSNTVITMLEGVIYKDNKEISDEERNLKIWIGTDESGKGDFFGPLVVAGFVMTREIESSSKELGIKDSKRLSSKQVQATARKLNELYNDHIEVVAPSVAKYNELYEKFKNLNSLLAWCHARVIDNLIQRWQQKNSPIDGVVSDQFGNEGLIRNALSSMKTVHLIQRPRGESNSAVAAASIIARDSFERRIAEIERETEMGIPFGAGQEVLEKAKEYVRKYGKENLSTIAKIHFKTFKQI